MATLVLPAPVGAQRRMFSDVFKAVSAIFDWIRFSFSMPLKASWVHLGSSAMGISLSSAGMMLFTAGT